MNSLVKLAAASIVGLGLGAFSAQAVIDGRGHLFNKQYGAWTSWPTAGTRSSNPYVRAHYLTHNRLPISQYEVNELEARSDNKGQALDGNCTYEISGKMPKTRWWSLYSFSDETATLLAFPKRAGLSSNQVIYRPDGSFRIKLSRQPQTGNWLIPAGSNDFVLVLRHYNPGRSIANQFTFDDLPTITREDCR